MAEAVQRYIHDVLRGLPDEVRTTPEEPGTGDRTLLNPYDPSQGFHDDEDEPPFDPWEAEAHAPDAEVLPTFLDIDALRRKAAADGA